MKLFPVLSASAVLGLAACDTMNAPISNSGFDPLLTPGAGGRGPESPPAFKARDLARAVMDNTFFFKQLPKGEAEADKTLLRGTGMKVIRVAGSYLQVELDVTGEVGYVPAVMVENASIPVPGTPAGPGGPTQVYPPLPGGPGDVNPIPPFDPRGQPPDGAIPTVIEPPATPVPTPGTVTPPVPPAPDATPTPDPVPPIEPKPAVPEKPKAEAPEETPIGAP